MSACASFSGHGLISIFQHRQDCKWPVQAQFTLLLYNTAPQRSNHCHYRKSPILSRPNRIKENSVCLNVSACTKQTHAASQSTVPLTAYEDGIYKFYKKKMKGKKTALLNYVEQINNPPTHAHKHTHKH